MTTTEQIFETLDRLEAQCKMTRAMLESGLLVRNTSEPGKTGLRLFEFQIVDFIVYETRRARDFTLYGHDLS